MVNQVNQDLQDPRVMLEKKVSMVCQAHMDHQDLEDHQDNLVHVTTVLRQGLVPALCLDRKIKGFCLSSAHL